MCYLKYLTMWQAAGVLIFKDNVVLIGILHEDYRLCCPEISQGKLSCLYFESLFSPNLGTIHNFYKIPAMGIPGNVK